MHEARDILQIRVDAQVGHEQVRVHGACENAGRRSSGREISAHLRGDLGGIGAHTPTRDTVVSGEDEDAPPP
jgi:hypothetical protein